MTWDDALNFCQSAGLRGLSLGSSKTEEDIEELMSKALDPDMKMETFWVAGYVLHPIVDGSVRLCTGERGFDFIDACRVTM